MKHKLNLILLKSCFLMSIAIMLFSLTACFKSSESSSPSSLSSTSDDIADEVTNEIAGELYLRTVYNSGSGSLNISWIFLGTDGTIIRNPFYGVNPIQKDKEIANDGQSVGVYTKTATGFDIKWADGSDQSLNAQFKNGKLSGFDGGVCTNAKSYATKSFPNETYTNSGVTLTLSSDNTFSWKTSMYDSNSRTYQETIKTGTYELQANTLKFIGSEDFIYNNRHFTVQPYDMGTTVDLILGTSHFKRKL